MKRSVMVTVLGFAMAAILLAGSPAMAVPVLVHQSLENFYDTGGTGITGCSGLGCPVPNFTFGNTSGTIQWEVLEKVFYDSATNTTRFVYTVANDAFSDPITSFHVDNAGILGTGGVPTGWAFSQTPTQWSWQTDSTAFGIPTTTTLNTMTVDIPGRIGVTFSHAYLDFLVEDCISTIGNGCYTERIDVHSLTGDWRASHPVPEPASLLLLGSGLTALGFFARRRRSKK